MFKKMKRSIEYMPRPAYIFIKITFILCDIMLFISFAMFMSADKAIGYGEKIMLAQLMLETPPGILLLSLLGFAFIYDHS